MSRIEFLSYRLGSYPQLTHQNRYGNSARSPLGSHAQHNLYRQSVMPMKKPTNSAPPKSATDSILECSKRAEQDIKEGKVYTHAQAKENLKKWLNT